MVLYRRCICPLLCPTIFIAVIVFTPAGLKFVIAVFRKSCRVNPPTLSPALDASPATRGGEGSPRTLPWFSFIQEHAMSV